MPEYMTRMTIELVDKREKTVDLDRLTAEQIVEGELFKRDAVCSVLVDPPVVTEGEAPPGGYTFAEIDELMPEFVNAVFTWIMCDCPAPKEEKGEEVLGVEDLVKFSDDAGGGTGAQSGDKGEGVGAAAVGVDATD